MTKKITEQCEKIISFWQLKSFWEFKQTNFLFGLKTSLKIETFSSIYILLF